MILEMNGFLMAAFSVFEDLQMLFFLLSKHNKLMG